MEAKHWGKKRSPGKGQDRNSYKLHMHSRRSRFAEQTSDPTKCIVFFNDTTWDFLFNPRNILQTTDAFCRDPFLWMVGSKGCKLYGTNLGTAKLCLQLAGPSASGNSIEHPPSTKRNHGGYFGNDMELPQSSGTKGGCNSYERVMGLDSCGRTSLEMVWFRKFQRWTVWTGQGPNGGVKKHPNGIYWLWICSRNHGKNNQKTIYRTSFFVPFSLHVHGHFDGDLPRNWALLNEDLWYTTHRSPTIPSASAGVFGLFAFG